MSKNKKRPHYMDDQLSIMKSIRKKMPRPTKVINPDKDDDSNWDWRKELQKSDGDDA